MSRHARPFRGATDDWLTPPELIRALGPFDLDPCVPAGMPWPTAARMVTPDEDGLSVAWEGRVWLNPPYGPETGRWLARLARHGTGTALIFARTETDMFFRCVWGAADAVLFLRGRLVFHRPDGSRAEHNGGAPSVLVAYGLGDAAALERAGLDGRFIRLRDPGRRDAFALTAAASPRSPGPAPPAAP